MRTIYSTLGLEDVSTLYAVNHCEREGVFRSRVDGRHRLVRLDAEFLAAEELRDFLVSLIQNSTEHHDLADAARRHIEQILHRR